MPYYIYLIPKVKVGVTCNLERRSKENRKVYGEGIDILPLLVFPNDHPIESIDYLEQSLARIFGFKGGTRYSISSKKSRRKRK